MFFGNLNSKPHGDCRMGKYTHLSSSDRRRFYTFLEMKLSIADIANRLGKHRSTLYRELERNKESQGYLPGATQLKTDERAQQKRKNKIEKDGYLQDYVVRSLKKAGVRNKYQDE